MEIRLPPDQEAHLAAVAASTGRSTDELVQEAVALWEEREHARTLAELRGSLEAAEASIRAGKGREVTKETLPQLVDDVIARCSARLAAEKNPTR